MRLTSRFFLACLGVLSLFLAHTGLAVTVIMKNGDLLSGDIVEREEDGLRLKVEYLGEVTLPKDKVENWLVLFPEVAVEAIPKAVADEPSGEQEAVAQGDSVAIGAQKAGGNGRALAPALAGYSEFLNTLLPFHNWKKRLQFGMTAQSGRKDKTDVYYRFDMNLKRKMEQFRFKANYYYGKAAEVKTSGKFSTDLRWRRDLAPGVFYETNSAYFSDDIKLIQSNFEQKLGLGTRFVESEVMTLSSGIGASGRWREFEQKEEEVVYLVDVFQDWDYKINERLSLRQDLRFAMPLEENDEYEYDFSAALVSELTETLNLSLRYEFGYDNSLRDALKEERRFVSSLGYRF